MTEAVPSRFPSSSSAGRFPPFLRPPNPLKRMARRLRIPLFLLFFSRRQALFRRISCRFRRIFRNRRRIRHPHAGRLPVSALGIIRRSFCVSGISFFSRAGPCSRFRVFRRKGSFRGGLFIRKTAVAPFPSRR